MMFKRIIDNVVYAVVEFILVQYVKRHPEKIPDYSLKSPPRRPKGTYRHWDEVKASAQEFKKNGSPRG